MPSDLPGDEQQFEMGDKALPTRDGTFMQVDLGTVVQELLDVGFELFYLL